MNEGKGVGGAGKTRGHTERPLKRSGRPNWHARRPASAAQLARLKLKLKLLGIRYEDKFGRAD